MEFLIIGRRAHVIKENVMSSSQSDCLRLLLSDPFCLLLSHLTGLQLSSHSLRLDPVPSENETETSTDGGGAEPCGCHGNWYCWERGDYTLMSDNDNEDEFVLEGRLYFDCNGNHFII